MAYFFALLSIINYFKTNVMPQTEKNRDGGNRNRENDMNQENQGTQQKRPGTQQQGLGRENDRLKKDREQNDNRTAKK